MTDPGPSSVHRSGDTTGGDYTRPAHSSNADIAEQAKDPAASQESVDRSMCGRHVDMATGEYVLPATDVALPGVLPLRLTRTHRSGFRHGMWFGASWACTFDTRVVIADDSVITIGADGAILAFDHPVDEEPSVARVGRSWRLRSTPSGGYRLSSPTGALVYHFEPKPHLGGVDLASGMLFISAITDTHRNRILFTYNNSGMPSAVEHSGGYRIGVDCDQRRIRRYTIAAATSSTVLRQFGYADENLISVTDAAGATRRFSYDSAQRMVALTDANGLVSTNAYDAAGRVITQKLDDESLSGTFTYRQDRDNTGSISSYTDATGATTVYGFDADLRPRAMADPMGRVIRADFNARRDPLNVTDAAGGMIRFVYTPDGDLAEVTDPLGAKTQIAYSAIEEQRLPARLVGPDQAETLYEYDGQANQIATRDAAGEVWRWEYHPTGAVAATIDPMGRRVDIHCNPAGLPIVLTDALGKHNQIGYDDFGRVTAIIDATGSATTFNYDGEGRLVSRTGPDGAAQSWAYDGQGNRIAHTDAAGATTRWEYGTAGLMTARIDATGAHTRYDYDRAGRLASVTNPAGAMWTYCYGADGQLVSETDFNGATTTYGYDRAGRLASRANGEGQTVSYSYDLAGRLTSESSGVMTEQSDRSAELFSGERIGYRYDRAGRTAGISMPWATVAFTRDPIGRVIKEDIDGRAVLSTFDVAGDLTTLTSPSGVDTVFGYDASGAVEALSVAGRRCDITTDANGRLTRYQYGSTAIDSTYDSAGRLTCRSVIAGVRDLSLLDLSGHRAEEKLVAAADYAYDASGSLVVVAGPADPAVAVLGIPVRHTVDPSGRAMTRTAFDGTTETTFFDAADNVTTAINADAHDTLPWRYEGMRLIDDGHFRCRYDAAGRLIHTSRVREDGEPETWDYQWDAWDRLRTVTTADGQIYRYTYDPAGRRIAKTGPDQTIRFSWSGLHLIEQVTTTGDDKAPTEVVTWSYLPGLATPQNQIRSVGLHSDGPDEPGPSQTLRPGELNLGAGPKSQRRAQNDTNTQAYAIVRDHAGIPVALIDIATGQIAGEITSMTRLGLVQWTGSGTPWRYPGQYHDAETGLHYTLDRYYDPAHGRFLTPAALDLGSEVNSYRSSRPSPSRGTPLFEAPSRLNQYGLR
ncbi:DUF6531 domain-containing protein [Mycobacterium sp. MUNTM1]